MSKKEGGWRILYPNRQFSKARPVVTIITAVYNSDSFFEDTIQSIVNQTYDNLEYIVVDGGSTDATLDIIKKYENKIAYWISEPDEGISDAFNKGVRLSKGTYINFQGAGDILESDNILENTFTLINGEPTFVSGRIKRVDEFDSNKTIYISTNYCFKSFSPSSLLWKMTLPHQGLFTHKRYFEDYGLFDKNLKYSMDYEHLLRAYKNFPSISFAGVVARWRADGLGNQKELEIYKEYDLIKRKNKIEPLYYLSAVNLIILLKHFLKKLFIQQ